MKRVAIVHTVRPVLASFPQLLEQVVGQPLKIHNLLDEFLASDPAEIGYFSVENRNRLFNDLKSCELTKADLIVVTCSTLTPAVQLIRPFINVPVVAIRMTAMDRAAVRIGKKDQGGGNRHEHPQADHCKAAAGSDSCRCGN